MRTLILSLMLAAAPARAEVAWHASSGSRYVEQRFDEGLDRKDSQGQDLSDTKQKRWELRASFGAFGSGGRVDWGLGARTQPSTGAVNTDWSAVQNGTMSTSPAVDVAYARLHGADYAVTVGRQRNALFHDEVAQALFGNDVRWDGFGWNASRGHFGVNLAQYVLGAANRGVAGASSASSTDASQSVASSQSHFGVLYAFQPYVKLHLGENYDGTLAIGYYVWNGTGGNDSGGFFDNQVHGGIPGAVGNVQPVSLDNARQWHVYGEATFPYDFRFTGEFVRNKTAAYGTRVMAASPPVNADRTAFALSLVLGKPVHVGDFSFQYSYSNKGIGALISAFSAEDIPADNISHLFELHYVPFEAVTLTAKLQYHREKANRGGDGQPVALPFNGRQETQRRYEISAQLAI